MYLFFKFYKIENNEGRYICHYYLNVLNIYYLNDFLCFFIFYLIYIYNYKMYDVIDYIYINFL